MAQRCWRLKEMIALTRKLCRVSRNRHLQVPKCRRISRQSRSTLPLGSSALLSRPALQQTKMTSWGIRQQSLHFPPKSAEHSLSRISSPLTLRPAEAAGAPSSQSQEVGAEDTGEGDEAAATAGRRWDQIQDGSAGQFQQGAAKSLVVDSVPGWQARAESPEVQLRGSGGTRKVAG